MGLECFSSFWNNLNSFCKPHQASVVGENSSGGAGRGARPGSYPLAAAAEGELVEGERGRAVATAR